MSLQIFYHALGLYGYHHLKAEQRRGAIYLWIVKAKRRCAHCGSYRVSQKGCRLRTIKTLPIGRKLVYAVIKVRRFECEECGRRLYEDLKIVDTKKHYTHALERYVMDLCSRMTILDVARHLGLHWATVKAIDKRRLKRELPRAEDLKKLRFLGVDEVSVGRRHRYLTIVVDLLSGRVVYVGEGRRFESLAPFFQRLKRLGVPLEAVALDMWKPYARAVRRYYRRLPLVYDPFHILADYSRLLNEIRLEEAEKLEGHPHYQLIKNSRYLLLKGQEKLSSSAQERLAHLLAINRPLFIAYLLKEDLRLLWKMPSKEEAEQHLADWIRKAFASGIPLLRRFARKLLRHAQGILNYFLFPISTAKVEGLNNLIKVVKRKAYGYRDLEYFQLKIYCLHTSRYSFLR